jgi:Na+-driven multidrug efflux pump
MELIAVILLALCFGTLSGLGAFHINKSDKILECFGMLMFAVVVLQCYLLLKKAGLITLMDLAALIAGVIVALLLKSKRCKIKSGRTRK